MAHASASAQAAKVLIVDDVPANLDLLYRTLSPQGYRILAAPNGDAALQAAKSVPDVILLDVMMPGLDGYDTCRRLKSNEATRAIPVIFITAQYETASVVEGFRAGGVDYISKPFQAEEVLARVETHLKISRLTRELAARNQVLEAEIARRQQAEDALQTADERLSLLSKREAERWGLEGFVGKSKTLEKILQDVRKLQQAGNISVLITGESGTGKELIARAIHFGSARSKAPFLPVNCSAIPKELAESLLFGHMRGAFSGANTDQKGYFELANGGTLFLDEIGDMPAALQAKLLRVLEDSSFLLIGATKEKRVDVRVVAASNVDFSKKIATGDFRQDLYFRLARFTVVAPPLRERPEDVAVLAAHFLKLFATEMGKTPPGIGAEALALLRDYTFPGNVRELKNVIERALIESGGREIRPAHLHLFAPTETPGVSQPAAVASGFLNDLPLNLDQAELVLVKRALEQAGGNVSKAAELLGVNRTRIYRLLPQLEQSDGSSKPFL
jgi:DNA-binding NtrC family response regulator